MIFEGRQAGFLMGGHFGNIQYGRYLMKNFYLSPSYYGTYAHVIPLFVGFGGSKISNLASDLHLNIKLHCHLAENVTSVQNEVTLCISSCKFQQYSPVILFEKKIYVTKELFYVAMTITPIVHTPCIMINCILDQNLFAC